MHLVICLLVFLECRCVIPCFSLNHPKMQQYADKYSFEMWILFKIFGFFLLFNINYYINTISCYICLIFVFVFFFFLSFLQTKHTIRDCFDYYCGNLGTNLFIGAKLYGLNWLIYFYKSNNKRDMNITFILSKKDTPSFISDTDTLAWYFS
jgi:hypothetical protein